MKIKHSTIIPIAFEGLEIRDFTADREVSSSVAEILVPPGVRHRTSWSKRSDKFYYIVEGSISFVLGTQRMELAVGDCCVVPKNTRFNYTNNSGEPAKLLLVHTPSFDLAEEVFEDESGTR
jgi:mannose-6-phosphate isomerase-like protein (cupin superfamily)